MSGGELTPLRPGGWGCCGQRGGGKGRCQNRVRVVEVTGIRWCWKHAFLAATVKDRATGRLHGAEIGSVYTVLDRAS